MRQNTLRAVAALSPISLGMMLAGRADAVIHYEFDQPSYFSATNARASVFVYAEGWYEGVYQSDPVVSAKLTLNGETVAT